MYSNKLVLQVLLQALRKRQTPARSLSSVGSYARRRTLLERRSRLQILKHHASTLDQQPEIMESFVKRLYKAEIDMSWIFPFPTFDTSKELNAFTDRSLKPIQDFFTGNILNSAKMDEGAEMPTELIEELKKLRLFGMTIPEEHGGLGLTHLKYTMLAEEIASADVSVHMMLASHNLLGALPLLAYASEEQQKNYLPKLATGEMVAAFCCNEASCGSDITTMQTRAILSEDGDFYLISGEKTSINNGAIADLMIVFAKTEVLDVNDVMKDTITAFLVERNFGGIYNGPQEDKLGMRAMSTCDVMFDETPVPVGNILGEVGQGFRIATDTLNDSRLGLVAGMIGPMRNIIRDSTSYASMRKQFGKRLKEFPVIQDKIFRMSQNTYVMESVSYLTMGKYDEAFEEELIPDLSVESAIAKVFCSEKALENANECMQIIGYRSYTKSLPYERLMRDARMLTISEGTSEVLKLYIALSCMQYVQNSLTERLRHLKVGTFRQKFTSFVDWLRDERGSGSSISGILRKRIPSFGATAPRQTLEWLDPHLEVLGDNFEVTVQSFYHKIYTLAQFYGKKINDEQLYLQRVAEVTILLYSIAAVVARCNKTLLLGLRNREQELMLTKTYVAKTLEKCEHLIEQLKGGYTVSVDREARRVGSEMLEDRRYIIAHPLELEHRYTEHPVYIDHLKNLKTLPES